MIQARSTHCGLVRRWTKAIVIGCLFGQAPQCWALVTSDGGPVGGTHLTTPGLPYLGLVHDGVGKMTVKFDDATSGTCSCSLLGGGGGRFALTAAHCVADGPDYSTTSVDVEWELPGGATFTMTATAALGEIHIHPGFTDDPFEGNDLAVLEFATPVPMAVPRYALNSDFGGELDKPVFLVGYGLSGHGSTGTSLPDGIKRAGLNEWNSIGLGALGAPDIVNNEDQLTSDFDSGIVSTDAFSFTFGTTGPLGPAGDSDFDGDFGYGAEEVMGGTGDSGGPGFIVGDDGVFRIAGVASYGTRMSYKMGMLDTEDPFGFSADVTTAFNSSWGEFLVHARVAEPDNLAFIRRTILPIPDGDYNVNGIVDAADYTVWRDTVGSIYDFRADGSGPTLGVPDGLIDEFDYEFWRLHFGEIGGAGSGSAGASPSPAAVPEPATWVLLVAVATIVAYRRQ